MNKKLPVLSENQNLLLKEIKAIALGNKIIDLNPGNGELAVHIYKVTEPQLLVVTEASEEKFVKVLSNNDDFADSKFMVIKADGVNIPENHPYLKSVFDTAVINFSSKVESTEDRVLWLIDAGSKLLKEGGYIFVQLKSKSESINTFLESTPELVLVKSEENNEVCIFVLKKTG